MTHKVIAVVLGSAFYALVGHAVTAGQAGSAEPDWIPRVAGVPSKRGDHAVAYDVERGRVVLFGGHRESGHLGDTWEWDGTEWTEHNPTTSPAPRLGHAMAYDGARGRVVLVAGHDLDVGHLDDTWEYGLGGCGAGGDTEPPVITASSASIRLWPPNHGYETIEIVRCVDAVSDDCASLDPADVVVEYVTSDEPDGVLEDSRTHGDIVIAPDGASVRLRRERQGRGNGRVYTLHLSVVDDGGNVGVATCLVTVPHSQNGRPAVDDGPVTRSP